MAIAIAPGAAPAEEDIRKRILDLLRAGLPVPDELLLAFSRAREASFHELSGLRADEREAALAKEVTALGSRVEALEEGGTAKPSSQARELLELGEKTRWLLWLSHAVAAEPHRDPLSFVRTEMDWVERSARDLERWDKRLKPSAEKILAAVDAQRSALLRCKLHRYIEGPDLTNGDPTSPRSLAHWLEAGESFDIEEEMAFRGPSGASSTPDLDRLRTHRAGHLKKCKLSLKEASLAEKSQFVQSGSADLLDHASSVLSESATAKIDRRIPALRSLRKRIEAFFHVLADSKPSLLQKDALPEEERRQREKDFKLLRQVRRRSGTAERENQVSLRLEKFFGPRSVKLFETFIIFLVFAFLALVLVEWELPQNSPLLPTIYLADLILCLFFQLDFLLRWAFAGWGGWYFARHFFFESLPALPYGLFFHYLSQARDLGALEEVRAVIVLRLLGLRSVILLTVRILRVVFFFVRGTDRAVEKFRALLDRDVVLFDPNPLDDAPESPLRRRILGIEERRQRALRSHYAETPWTERASILRYYLDLLDLETRVCAGLALPYVPVSAQIPGELHLERVIHRCLDCDAPLAISVLGHDGTERAARWLRFFDVPVIRSGPFVRKLIPAARIKSPPDAVAGAAHAVGQMLQNFLGALRFWGDLSGITTGPQILDRMATAVIAASKRPAVRLLFFGGLFLFFKGLAQLVGVHLLETTANNLLKVLGLPLLILGSICLIILLTGRWLKRIAGEALDVYLRTADAHFYSLLKLWKLHRKEKDLQAVYRRVFLPEKKLRGNGCASEEEWLRFLGEPVSGPEGHPDFLPYRQDREAVALLYRDFLDGPILHREDDKTSVQLLGNLVVQEIRFQTLGMTRKEMRKLEWLDLEKYRLLGLGPYFWFRFITESLAIETAKLVMEYNSRCVPLDQLSLASPAVKQSFLAFLAARTGEWDANRRSGRALQCLDEPLITDEFTALDFLSADETRDEIVRRRFGEEVAAALRRDRRGMVRDIFGTRPYHLLPRSERVFNPYQTYQRYLSGAKFLFLPLFVGFGVLKLFFACLRQVVRLVEDVLGRERSLEQKPSRVAGFDVATRKINRMRKPFFMEALKLRARIDIEYLGLRLPGFDREEGGPDYLDDLDFVGALEGERRPLGELRNAALRDLRRFRNFLGEKNWLESGMEGLLKELDPSGDLLKHRGEVVRALVTAYITDHEALRSTLTARAAARSFVERALERRETLGSRLGQVVLGRARWLRASDRRRRSLLEDYLKRAGEFRDLSPRFQRKVRRAFVRSAPETERIFALALEGIDRQGSGQDAIFEKLRRAAFDYKSWTRKVMKIRALQAITVLDIQSYRDLVWTVGDYQSS
jgi:hypothetical protein